MSQSGQMDLSQAWAVAVGFSLVLTKTTEEDF